MDRFPALDHRRPLRDSAAQLADRVLRIAGDMRLAAALLVLAALWNALAAAAPNGPAALDSPVYPLLLGAILVSGMAGVAVRLPVAWREWRHPGASTEGRGTLVATVDAALGPAPVATRLARLGYRVVPSVGTSRWAVHGVRRGWSRLAGLGSHVALLLMVIGAGIGSAFASETTFSLLPGEQALLDAPRPGFTDAVRYDALDATFDADGRARRLDTSVTFLRDGRPVTSAVLQVNAPGSFGGYLVHGWTYGPAARLRITTLGDRVLHDGPVALDRARDGRPATLLELPSAGDALAVVLADGAANTVAVSAGGNGAPADATLLRPGDTARLGSLRVRLDSFTSWVTFASRRDPGMGLLFVGAGLLSLSLAVVLWLPRRRVSVRAAGDGLRIVLRGERFDTPAGELERIRRALAAP
ncbi:MAG: cytochrome c biogenesis protein ResB [Chloroflexota bacterium]